MAQVAREKALTRFRGDTLRVLVATDVAARGIDVQGVSHVINYTCPEDEKTYVHRIGRTGRAGATGIAVTFVDWADLHRWKMINKALDLPFDEPQETYSTSEHLYHDLGHRARHQGAHQGPGAGRARPALASRRERSAAATVAAPAAAAVVAPAVAARVAAATSAQRGLGRPSGTQPQPRTARPQPQRRARRRGRDRAPGRRRTGRGRWHRHGHRDR